MTVCCQACEAALALHQTVLACAGVVGAKQRTINVRLALGKKELAEMTARRGASQITPLPHMVRLIALTSLTWEMRLTSLTCLTYGR